MIHCTGCTRRVNSQTDGRRLFVRCRKAFWWWQSVSMIANRRLQLDGSDKAIGTSSTIAIRWEKVFIWKSRIFHAPVYRTNSSFLLRESCQKANCTIPNRRVLGEQFSLWRIRGKSTVRTSHTEKCISDRKTEDGHLTEREEVCKRFKRSDRLNCWQYEHLALARNVTCMMSRAIRHSSGFICSVHGLNFMQYSSAILDCVQIKFGRIVGVFKWIPNKQNNSPRPDRHQLTRGANRKQLWLIMKKDQHSKTGSSRRFRSNSNYFRPFSLDSFGEWCVWKFPATVWLEKL